VGPYSNKNKLPAAYNCGRRGEGGITWRNLELSVKSGKYSTSNPEFGHKEDEIKKDLKQSTLAFKGGGGSGV